MATYKCPLCDHRENAKFALYAHVRKVHEIEGDFTLQGNGSQIEIIPKEQTPHGT